MSTFDVIIVGGGIAGATAALALAKENFSVALIDNLNLNPTFELDKIENRVSAYSLASIRALQALEVWDAISSQRLSPYKHMEVWDASTQAQINFKCDDIDENTLGYILEDKIVRNALLFRCSQAPNIYIFSSSKLISFSQDKNLITLLNEKNEALSARILIGADGANSWVREKANIEYKNWDYGHTAIIATVQTEVAHQSVARQCFTSTGPLAFLPLTNNRSSIVWSQPHEQAADLMQLNAQEFVVALQAAFGNSLGKIELISEPKSFPLKMRHAKKYIQPHIALIGDAAHTLHPLAGQGINLGILDALALAEVLTQAKIKNRDFAHHTVLRRYERWRRSENLVMLGMVDSLKILFCNNYSAAKFLRSAGLNFTNRTKLIKNFLTAYAVGNRENLPMLARSQLYKSVPVLHSN